MVYQSCDYLNGFDTSNVSIINNGITDLKYTYKLQFVGYNRMNGGLLAFDPTCVFLGAIVLNADPPKAITQGGSSDTIGVYKYKSSAAPMISLGGQLTLFYNIDFTTAAKPDIKAGDYLCCRSSGLASGNGPAPLANGGFDATSTIMLALEDAKPGEFFDVLMIPVASPSSVFRD